MKPIPQHISGSLLTISLISWGILIWNHFPNTDTNLGFLWILAIFSLGIAIEIETEN